ncbi:hypothetical protein NKR23_g8432 [Pleurostoma richardsiae]|uniref:DUF7907 domain-containing protein n=1 Tax=Pleurostoma richardsiae TaxID=41990 RepID=A0AA38RKB8_9PEZI|nr:hypothetical protein NKR23_g8432 [Pleurostoma richardsiae]
MHSSLLAITLSTLAAAAPHSARQVPNYPPTSSSQGFKLVANVTDPSKDLIPSIKSWTVQAYHTGAGTNVAVLAAATDASPGSIFYENGTAEAVRYGDTTVLTDEGTPPAPYGIYVDGPEEYDPANPDLHGAVINVGQWSRAGISQFPNPYPVLFNGEGTGTFVACSSFVPYYQRDLITLDYAYATFTAPDGSYEYNANIPEGCAPVTLVPECAQLNELPEGSFSSHEFAATERCYDDVASIDWTQYGP